MKISLKKIFSRKVSAQAPVSAPAYRDIGLKASPAEFGAAIEKAEKQDWQTLEDSMQARKDLLDGARQAFAEQRPGNLQVALFEKSEFFGWPGEYRPSKKGKFFLDTLLSLSNGDDTAAVLVLVFQGRDGEKQQALNDALRRAVTHEHYYPLILPVIQAGADLKALGGEVLATAVIANVPAEVIGTLSDNGADFDKAVLYAQKNNFGAATVLSLKAYQAERAEPAVPKAPGPSF